MQTSDIISRETTRLSGEWIGSIIERDQPEFIRISFDEQWCDLPQRKQFNLRLLQGKAENTFTVADFLSFQIWDKADGQGMRGDVNETSRFHLWPIARTDKDPNQTIGGSYRLENGRDLFIVAESGINWPVWQSYYREGDRLLRLYPLDTETYLSEAGETFTFSGDKLIIRDVNNMHIPGFRVSLYNQETLEIAFGTGYKLVGSLLTPNQPAPHPLVILVHGAGPGLRSDYLTVADIFARQGIAVFIYDKRGWGESTGEQLWSQIFKLADDVEAVIQYMRHHPKVDASRIGLWGFSNGGWVAPLAASRCADIAFVISFSGSGVSPARQEQIRRCTVAKDVLGASAEQVALLARFWEHAFRFGATGEWTSELESLIDAVDNDQGLQALPKHEQYPDPLQPVPPKRTKAKWLASGGQGKEMAFDPVPIFQGLSAQILFVWGEQDSVVPAEESRRAIMAGLADHTNYTIFMVPKAGHALLLLDDTIYCQQIIGDEYQTLVRVPRAYAPGLWGKIISWVKNIPLIS